MDGRTDSPCVLQDFVPFGAAALLPLNLNHILLKQGTGTADHLLPLGCYWHCCFFYLYDTMYPEGHWVPSTNLRFCDSLSSKSHKDVVDARRRHLVGCHAAGSGVARNKVITSNLHFIKYGGKRELGQSSM